MAAGLVAANAALLVPDQVSDIACYDPMPTEPRTDVLIAALRIAGHRVWLPRVHGDQLQWVTLRDDTTWTVNSLGIREPDGPATARLPDSTSVMFIPALAVDRDGHRLGQGGGFYDRALLDVVTHADGGPLIVAIVFADEVLAEVPTQAHDRRVDAIVTDLPASR